MKIIVTRHQALVEHLREIGLCAEADIVVSHATEDMVAGKDVIGVLPLRLAAFAASVTEVPLALPEWLRGQELTIEQVRQYAGKPATYVVAKKAM